MQITCIYLKMYFNGLCSMYNVRDHWHHYIKIDCKSIDIILFWDLFLEKAEVINIFNLFYKLLINKILKSSKFISNNQYNLYTSYKNNYLIAQPLYYSFKRKKCGMID